MATFSNSTHKVVAVPNDGTIKDSVRVKPSDMILKSLIESGAINGYVGASAPDPATFDWWLDDTASPATLKRYKTGAWVASTYDPFSGTPGLKFQFSATTIMADPTAGYFRLNNATLASVTAMAISDTLAETGAPDVAAFINAWQAGAQDIIQDPVSPQNLAIYTVGAVTDNSGWSQVALTHVASAGSLVNGQRYSTSYSASGPEGDPGTDGSSAGLYFAFSTTTTMADPGDGIVRFNNATPASVTAIAIDDTSADSGNPDISAEIISWDDSTAAIKGRLIFREIGSPQNFYIYSLTGLTDNAGWSELAVTHVAGNGTFADADNLSVEFQRTGNNGADGAGAVDSVNSQTGVVVLDPEDLDDSATTNKFASAAQLTKVDYLSVTQAVDLDQMETDIAALANGMVYKGNWDASSGSFPGAGAAQIGWFYTVSVGGTVDSVEFTANDAIIAIADNASTTTYASNWSKRDTTDAVQSVVGQVGAVTAQQIATAIDADATAENTLRNAIPASTTAKGTVEIATSAEFRTGTDAARALGVSETWGAGAEVTLVYSTADIVTSGDAAPDASKFFNAAITLTQNSTLPNMTNAKPGQNGCLRFVQDGTGSRTLSLGSNYETRSGGGITLSTDAAAEDCVFYHVISSSRIVLTLLEDIS